MGFWGGFLVSWGIVVRSADIRQTSQTGTDEIVIS